MVHTEAGRVSWGGGGLNILYRGRNVHQDEDEDDEDDDDDDDDDNIRRWK